MEERIIKSRNLNKRLIEKITVRETHKQTKQTKKQQQLKKQERIWNKGSGG